MFTNPFAWRVFSSLAACLLLLAVIPSYWFGSLIAQDCQEWCKCMTVTCFDYTDGGPGMTWLDEFDPPWCGRLFVSSDGQDGQGDNAFSGSHRHESRDGYHCGCPNLSPNTYVKETGATVDGSLPWEPDIYHQYCNHCAYCD